MNNIAEFITTLYIPLVVVFCCIIGYILKHWIDDLDNKYIPTILTIIGAIAGCLVSETVTFGIIVAGAASGLAATGMHQAFKQIIDGKNK